MRLLNAAGFHNAFFKTLHKPFVLKFIVFARFDECCALGAMLWATHSNTRPIVVAECIGGKHNNSFCFFSSMFLHNLIVHLYSIAM